MSELNFSVAFNYKIFEDKTQLHNIINKIDTNKYLYNAFSPNILNIIRNEIELHINEYNEQTNGIINILKIDVDIHIKFLYDTISIEILLDTHNDFMSHVIDLYKIKTILDNCLYQDKTLTIKQKEFCFKNSSQLINYDLQLNDISRNRLNLQLDTIHRYTLGLKLKFKNGAEFNWNGSISELFHKNNNDLFYRDVNMVDTNTSDYFVICMQQETHVYLHVIFES
jgi:hypothetical protein